MCVPESTNAFACVEVPMPPYRWFEIVSIAFVGCMLTLCCIMGLGFGIWAIAADHMSLLSRVGQLVLACMLIGAPVAGFILRGRRGIRLSLACCYVLFVPVVSLLAAGGISAAVVCALCVVAAIATLHRPYLQRFYRAPGLTFRDHVIASFPTFGVLIPFVIWS